jgi:hypothetical protein
MKFFKPLIILLCVSLSLLSCQASSSLGGTETGNAEDKAPDITGGIDVVSLALRSAISQGQVTFAATASSCATAVETVTCSDTTFDSTIIDDFDGGCSLGNDVTLAGKRYYSWTNMGELSCSYVDDVAGRPYFSRATRGDGAHLVVSTDVIPDSQMCDSPQASDVYTLASGDLLTVTACAEFDFSDFGDVSATLQTVTETLTIAQENLF